MEQNVIICTPEEMQRTLERLSYEVLERHGDCKDLALLGIQRRGVYIANRINLILEKRLGYSLPQGELDINFYRDDWTTLSGKPAIGRTHIPFQIGSYKVLLVDDVLYTGRTIRAALEAIQDHERPKKVELLALIDRGLRELPIHADFVGKYIYTNPQDHINVTVKEVDDLDEVELIRC